MVKRIIVNGFLFIINVKRVYYTHQNLNQHLQ